MRLPFVAVVGQEPAKRALLLATVEPLLGGVLLRGDKGSAKTTLARGLAALLPGDAPFVELPLGASEDRVLGALDLGELLTNATPAFRPGLLAAAHGGVLYVDEINLLADHLVDALLDVAVSGVNRVERDGLSHTHPARFVLVASMNPEEGELRPQLLDRFGLAVEVRAPAEVGERVEAVRRQLALESIGAHEHDAATAVLRARIVAARSVVPTVDDEVLYVASAVALGVGAEGLRADLMLVRAARANAALDGRVHVEVDDVRAVAESVLAHRRRRRPFEQPGIDREELDDAFDRATPPPPSGPGSAVADAGGQEANDASRGGDGVSHGRGGAAEDRLDAPGAPALLRLPDQVRRTGRDAPSGRGTTTTGPRGRTLRAAPLDGAAPADPQASAVSLATRRALEATPDAAPTAADLRQVSREQPSGSLVVFVVDASGSMGAEHRMATTKAAVIALLGDAYRRRCRVALVTFRDDAAQVVLRPTASIEIARACLTEVRTGGTSPIAAGLREAGRLASGATGDRNLAATVVLVTDGRASCTGVDAPAALAAAAEAAAALARQGASLVVVDSESGPTRLGFARRLAADAGAPYLALDDLDHMSGPALAARFG